MEKTLSDLGFESSADRFSKERERRIDLIKNPTQLGIKFLDDMLVGLTKHDILLVGAKTGVGKTELVNSIATANARAGKKVFMFALEAAPEEMERRARYKILSEAYKKSYPGRFVTYRDFIWKRYNKDFEEMDLQFEENLGESYFKNLFTFYRKGAFNISSFEKIFSVIEERADLVILDHIHFFDMETENENKELGEITKRIRDLALISGVPVIIVGHLRKPSENSKKVMPDQYDFHGSSNLPKQITRGLIIEGGGVTDDGKLITLMRVVKDRDFGAVQKYVGKVLFDPTTNSYSDDYKLCLLTDKDTKLTEIQKEDYPIWLKNC